MEDRFEIHDQSNPMISKMKFESWRCEWTFSQSQQWLGEDWELTANPHVLPFPKSWHLILLQ